MKKGYRILWKASQLITMMARRADLPSTTVALEKVAVTAAVNQTDETAGKKFVDIYLG
jgi:hypothetical protein